LDIVSGLPFLKMRPFTDSEWHTLPHVILTSDADWDPSVLDQLISETDDWYNSIPDKVGAQDRTPFDAFGDLRPELLHEEADQVLDDIEVHLHSLLYVNERYMPDVNFDPYIEEPSIVDDFDVFVST
jgi:hypothetical protein